jgi:SAM-dependent MidA family methyltransferase
MNVLEEFIRGTIGVSGPMRFDRFMERALYQPGQGYYAKKNPPAIGRKGDFYTSVSVGKLFGRLLARQFFEMWEVLGKPDPFWIIEQGAHDGQLATDILNWCRAEAPDFWPPLRYGIVDGPPIKDTIALRSPDLENPIGVFFSNELVDAFPVRVVIFLAGQWLERRVDLHDEKLIWVDRPINDPQLIAAIQELAPPEIEGYTTEINLKARDWIADIGRSMRRGYVVTIDYGFLAPDYYAPHRTSGTLRGYANHQMVNDVLANLGEQDITAHVDFTALMRAGESAGLTTLGFLDQQRFLTGIANDELGGATTLRAGISDSIRSWNSLTHPEHLGTRFRVLVQGKDALDQLSGLRFARPGDLP